jgi:hypothetical protein
MREWPGEKFVEGEVVGRCTAVTVVYRIEGWQAKNLQRQFQSKNDQMH